MALYKVDTNMDYEPDLAVPGVFTVVHELQGLRFAVVNGAVAATNIPLPGIKPEDTVVAVLELQPPSAASGNAVAGDRAAQTTIPADDNIQVSVSTTGNQLLVVYFDKR